MSLRNFVFCDYCNRAAVRTIEDRRKQMRPFEASGRRISDGRAWFEGTRQEAQAAGWRLDSDNLDICPHCLSRGLGAFGDRSEAEP